MATQGIKFLHRFSVGEYNTQFPGVNVISVTSTATGDFDKTNLTTSPLREVWRSATASVTQEIIIQANDMNTVVDTFAILNHNLSPLAVVQLQAAFDTGFLAPAFTINFQYSERHLVLLQDLGIAYRYYKIKIIDPTNPCGYIQIGRIIAGKSFTMTNDEDVTDDIKIGREDKSYQMRTEGFFRASNERIKLRKLSVRFEKIQTLTGFNTNYVGLNDVFDNVGTALPFLTCVDPQDPYFCLIWGQFTALPTDDLTVNRYASLSLSIEEVF